MVGDDFALEVVQQRHLQRNQVTRCVGEAAVINHRRRGLCERCRQQPQLRTDHSPSTNVVEFVLQPDALLNQLVTLVKQVASTVFNLLLEIADLGG